MILLVVGSTGARQRFEIHILCSSILVVVFGFDIPWSDELNMYIDMDAKACLVYRLTKCKFFELVRRTISIIKKKGNILYRY